MNQMAYFRRKVYEPCWNDTNRNTQANQKPDQIRTVTLWLSTCKYTQRDVQACHLANHIRNCKNEVHHAEHEGTNNRHGLSFYRKSR